MHVDNNNVIIVIILIYLTMNAIQIDATISTTQLIDFDKNIYCFDCKMALKPFTFSNGAILPRVNCGAAVKLE